MRTEKRMTPYSTERKWFFVAVVLFLVSIFLYMYFVIASVHHVVLRKETDMHIATLGSRVSELESAYIEAQHAVSADIASMHGFITPEQKFFIDRTDQTLVFSGN